MVRLSNPEFVVANCVILEALMKVDFSSTYPVLVRTINLVGIASAPSKVHLSEACHY
jgi:hypothetical protein